MVSSTAFSDYIVYVDESGDHGLAQINPQNPVFVLAFCIFNKTEYAEKIVPEIQKLKFRFWGHDNVILHSRDIRKATGDFAILQNKHVREAFLEQLTHLMETLPYTVVGVGIDKTKFKQTNAQHNPYEAALKYGFVELLHWLLDKSPSEKLMHIICEKRGKTEDNALELEFYRYYEPYKISPNYKLQFMPKQHNSTGLQFADLVAYPLARHLIKPAQENRAFDAIHLKLYKFFGADSDTMEERAGAAGVEIFPLKAKGP